MKLYRISQNMNNGYDTYDSAIVCAESKSDARKIHPDSFVTHHKDGKWYGTHSVAPFDEYEMENGSNSSWVQFKDINKLKIEYLGEAKKGIKRGVILSSFNAG